MDPILDKARAGQNVLERIANAIPGFKGYREREMRRDADRLQREHLAARLGEVKKVLNQLSSDITRSGSLDAMNDVETARKRLDKLIARIRWADQGYAGFFDPVKVDESTLARVYEFDLSLIEGVERVVTTAAGAAGGTDKPAERARAVVDEVDALDARLAEREQMLGGIR
jgi:hypothetical protein